MFNQMFKARLRAHRESFNHGKYAEGCEPATYVWEIKDNKMFDIKCRILKRVNEKLYIIENPKKGTFEL